MDARTVALIEHPLKGALVEVPHLGGLLSGIEFRIADVHIVVHARCLLMTNEASGPRVNNSLSTCKKPRGLTV